MLEQQDLQAIAELIEQSIAKSETRMKEYVGQSEARMKAYTDITAERTETRIKAYIEQTSEKEIRILAESYQDLYKRLPATEEQDRLRGRVSVLEHAVKGMRTELDTLEKAQ